MTFCPAFDTSEPQRPESMKLKASFGSLKKEGKEEKWKENFKMRLFGSFVEKGKEEKWEESFPSHLQKIFLPQMEGNGRIHTHNYLKNNKFNKFHFFSFSNSQIKNKSFLFHSFLFPSLLFPSLLTSKLSLRLMLRKSLFFNKVREGHV